MSLTSEQELEMYADIKVIKSNCLGCKKCIDDHENRIKFLERAYWIFFGVASIALYVFEILLK